MTVVMSVKLLFQQSNNRISSSTDWDFINPVKVNTKKQNKQGFVLE